jgi:hypothetical protein
VGRPNGFWAEFYFVQMGIYIYTDETLPLIFSLFQILVDFGSLILVPLFSVKA